MTKEAGSVVPGVFPDRHRAEDAIDELREFGLTDEEIGIATPAAGRYKVKDERESEELTGTVKGAAAGAPIGTLAGLALSAVIVPVAGPLAVGGLLAGGVGGAIWGTFTGAFTGFTAKVRLDDYEDRWCEIPIGGSDVLVVARSGERADEVRKVMEKHGAKCFLDEVG